MTNAGSDRPRPVRRSLTRRAAQRLDRLRRGLVSSYRAVTRRVTAWLDRLPRPDELPGG
jgi:hypothetical protein